jgi:hypothetical protein
MFEESMQHKSLWPDNFKVANEPTPESIPEAQAIDLKDKTSGKLSARVDIGTIGDRISLDFTVIAPELNGYEYRLFKVLRRVFPSFDAEFVVAGEQPVKVTTQPEFETELTRILQSNATKRLISELLGMIDQRLKIRKVRKA